jgi:hypothetical protein
MHLKAKRPVFVPQEHWKELEQLSKAALMDMVWDYCIQIAGNDGALEEFRKRAGLIKHYRKEAKVVPPSSIMDINSDTAD